jgi:protein-S-isoprenylcysteine O-methyltransferase Ste14
MMLRQRLLRDGQWLFAQRSLLPVFILIPALAAFLHPGYPFQDPDRYAAWSVLCGIVAMAGQVIRLLTIAHVPRKTSGRNRTTQVAESLNTDGAYSLVRNPIYVGNCLTWLGLAALPGSLPLWAIVAVVFWIYHERVIYTEESFLEERFGDVFRNWAQRTPAFLPNPRLWRPPALGFSWRYAIGREFEGFFLVALGFTLVDILVRSAAERRLAWCDVWVASTVGMTGVFLGIRWLRKNTSVFRVEGRTW